MIAVGFKVQGSLALRRLISHEIRVKSVVVSYFLQYIPNYHCKASQLPISHKVSSTL